MAEVVVVDPCGLPVGPPATAEGGCYVWQGLTSGSHTVIVTVEGLAAAIAGAVVRPDAETEITVLLDRASCCLSGSILDVSSGAGLPGATVLVMRGVEIARIGTDATGGFLVTGLCPGYYVVTVQADGFGHASQGLHIGAGGSVKVEIALQSSPGLLSGIVLDGTTMLPVPDAAVQIIMDGQTVFTAAANALGRFGFPPVTPGRYLLIARNRGYGHCARGITVQPGLTARAELVIWPFRGSLSGTLRDRITGEPVAGAMISARDSLGTPVAAAVTDLRGEYRLPDLAENAYLISAQAAGYQIAQSGAVVSVEEETHLDLFTATGAGLIEGTVTVDGRPLPGGSVHFSNQDEVAVGMALTDAHGRYASAGLPPGAYKVVVSAPGHLTGRIGATVTAGFRCSASVETARGNSQIAGTVHTDKTRPGIAVIASTPKGLVVAKDWVDADENYILPGLAPGRYRLSLLSSGYASATMEVEATDCLSEAPPLDLQDTPAILTGLVRSGDLPLAGAVVRALSRSGGILGQSLTDSAGRYFLTGLPAGASQLVCSAYEHTTAIEAAHLTEGSCLAWDAVLDPAPAHVLELIRDTAGHPVPGAEIRVSDSEGRHLFTLLTNEEGFFWLRAWAKGSIPWLIEH